MTGREQGVVGIAVQRYVSHYGVHLPSLAPRFVTVSVRKYVCVCFLQWALCVCGCARLGCIWCRLE